MQGKFNLTPAVLGMTLVACSDPIPRAEPGNAGGAIVVATGKAPLKSGEQVYREVCMACHATGVADAPKFGDDDDWEDLIEEGQARVTAHGWVGMGAMPPRGGRADLTQEEFARAVAWMARHAGGDWSDPDAAMLHAIREEEEDRIEELEKKRG